MEHSGDFPDGITKTYDLNGALEHEYTYSKKQLILGGNFDRQGNLIRTQEFKPQMFSPY
jgi:antitoxin component YwqK of YwqJK toxin-antitoxin module|tara:strand:+ start:429 stop:605 length:177 start_codon:yes stop_codon:yes gene_type:complete